MSRYILLGIGTSSLQQRDYDSSRLSIDIPSYEEPMVNALAPNTEEGRDRLR